ncbi:hypothetical protein A9Q98_09255 [Thalassotalea sp. 42_200_T64]|nr:hypothetical protein A9Q98_09255 [Thalassotalea sp. 42_200_T64]
MSQAFPRYSSVALVKKIESPENPGGLIVDVLMGHEKLIDGLGQLTSGVKRALVCGPFLSV